MTASTTVFATAVSATAQFGNSFDTSGYREHHPVVVLASMKHFPLGSELFLIVDAADQMLGIATKVDNVDQEDPIKGEYYCTNARRLSDRWSVDRALNSLGFKEVDPDLIHQYL